jgi:hypothetical protein
MGTGACDVDVDSYGYRFRPLPPGLLQTRSRQLRSCGVYGSVTTSIAFRSLNIADFSMLQDWAEVRTSSYVMLLGPPSLPFLRHQRTPLSCPSVA